MEKLSIKRTALASGMLALLSGFPFTAQAGAIFGDGLLGDFTGNLAVAVVDADTATLTVSLLNTSPAANGGFLTAFVLNNPADTIGSISNFGFTPNVGTTAGPWSLLGLANDAVDASPFGNFDFGACVPPVCSFQGDGPTTGLGVGEGGSFAFTLEGPDVDLLTQLSFETAFPKGGSEFLVARFRGFEDGDSDKVPAVVPIPAAAWLLGSGLFALIAIGRRNRSANANAHEWLQPKTA